MNFKLCFMGILALAACGASGVPATISGVTVENGWPWRAATKLAFTVDAGDPVDVEVTAMWDGQATPVDLIAAGVLTGIDPFNTGTGRHEGEIDLLKIGELGTQIKDFKVTVTPLAKVDRMFLYVDIKNGRNVWMKTRPDSILSDDYLKNGILFRRVLGGPVGTYTNGIRKAICDATAVMYDCTSADRLKPEKNPQSLYNKVTEAQPIGFSSDYFISCNWITKAQWKSLGAGSEDSWEVQKASLNTLRGATNVVAGTEGDVRWPTTGFYVKPDSKIAAVRTRLEAQLPSGWVLDVPTFTQREIASRCGRNTIWWNGGDETTRTDEALSNLVSVCTTWGRHNRTTHPGDYTQSERVPGQMTPNDWGLWEPNGGLVAIQLCGMDANGNAADYYKGMDPVGVPFNGKIRIQGVGNSNWEMIGTVPSRSYTGELTQDYCFRLVLNTTNWPNKPLK